MKKANKGRVGLIIALAATISCGSAVAISQLCLNGNNIIAAYADTTTYVAEQDFTTEQIAALWASAVQKSIDTGAQVTFTLECDWTAQPTDASYLTSFGSADTGFSSGRITVPSDANIVLDLNGHTVDRALQSVVAGGCVINVSSSGTLEITDSSESGEGAIIGGYASALWGGGVRVLNGTLTLSGGTIRDNHSINGAGVLLMGGSFTMNGGEISGNTANNNGGGVYINRDDAKFELNGGKISGNTASAGGGVYVYNETATFTMNGGEISGNTAEDGSAVDVATGTFNMNWGIITGNTASDGNNLGAVYNEDVMNLTGGIIYGNYDENGDKNNIVSDNPINITDKLAVNTFVSFNTNWTDGVVTEGYKASGNSLSKAANYFACDFNDYEVSDNGSEINLVHTSTPVEKEVLDWSYGVYDASLNKVGDDVEIGEGVISAKETYTGGAFVFNAFGEGLLTAIDQNGKTVTNFVNVGTYYLNVKPQYAAGYENPFFTFEILPADISEQAVTVKTDPVTYTGEEVTTSVKVFLGGVMLEEGKDYTLSYEDNVSVGEGKVIITALGNYTGTVEGNFTIEKAKLGVRYGVLELTYNGGVQGIEVFPEGLKGDDEVTLTVKYYLEDGVTECDPEGVGKYVAKVILDDDTYELSRRYETYFTIGSKKVDVVWSDTEFEYDGNPHEITAYFVDSEGNHVDLIVTMPEDTNAGNYTATTELPATGYENYELTESTLSKKYTISKKDVEAVWGDLEFKFDGNDKEVEVTLEGVGGVDLSEDLECTYYDAEGNELTSLPVDAGDYKVVIAITVGSFADGNYKLTGATEQTVTIEKANLKVTLNKNAADECKFEYDGEGKLPVASVADEYDTPLAATAYKTTYAPADENGNATGDFVEEAPKDAGKYLVKVEVDADNVEQSEYVAVFEITAKTVTVVWDFGKTAVEIDGVYTYLYNGKAHQPKATADGIELTVNGTGKSVGDGYTTTASLNDSNYVLSGTLIVMFNVIKSQVESVRWYEYGAIDPVTDSDELSYEYISVYGQEGPRFTAYGVLKPADSSISWAATEAELITLDVTYPRYSSGYWTELGTYKAEASISSMDAMKDACYMPLGINDEIEFEVTAITHSASKAQIKWVIEVNGKHVELTSGYEFTYTGDEIVPMAIRVLSTAYDPDDLDPSSYEVLTVGGGKIDVGTYYTYIIPDKNATYEIKEADAEFCFVIVPEKIKIDWEDKNDDGEIIFTYNGGAQAPKAYIVDNIGDAILDANGDKIYLTVEGYTDAGTYFAIADTDDNHEIVGDNFIGYTIEQLELSVDDIVWAFETGDEGKKQMGIDGKEYFVWDYDGNEHKPTAILEVVLVEGQNPVEIKLTITGGTSAAGSHYAYVTLDSTDYVNANYKLDIARLKFEIIRDSVEIVWEDVNADGEIIREYNGNAYEPKAYYLDGEGNRVDLTVVGSGKNAGTYVACVTDDITASNSKTIVFTIKAKELSVDWDRTTVTYNGELRVPTLKFYNTVTDDDGNETQVTTTLRLGTDYTVTGYTNAGKYTSKITLLNGNYTLADGDNSHEFIINKREVTLSWYGVGGYDEETGVGDTTDFEWSYSGELIAPTAGTTVEGLEILIKGAEKNVGTYTAVAVLKNDNYKITNPKQEFSIKGSTITVIWEGREVVNDDGTTTEVFSWQYEGDGTKYAPKAYIQLEDGSKGGELEVVVDGGIYAGDYTAYAILPANCEWADGVTGECEFTVTKKIVDGIVWSFDGATEKVDEDGNTYYEVVYNGDYLKPTAKIASTGEVLTVLGAAVNKGEYTATAVLANSDNYEFATGDDGASAVQFEIRFVILAKEASVTWKGENDSESDFEWAYDGEVHCPTAWFKNVNGVWVEIPVVGGSASGGEHLAELKDLFDNYDFPEAKWKKLYKISEIDISVEWNTDGDDATVEYDENDFSVITSITYTYSYNGKAHMPVVVATDAEGNTVLLNYVIKAGEEAVGAIINVGEYTLTVSPADRNNKIGDGCITEVKVIVKALEVAVEWGDKEFTYNGAEQAPKAWFEYEDGNGQTITIILKVEGTGKEVGDNYTATVAFESDNFVLKGETEVTFKIIPSTASEWTWDWDANDGLGGWVEVKDETSEGEGGETPEEGDDTDLTDQNEGGSSEATDPEEDESGTTNTEPENSNTVPAQRENLTPDPRENIKHENDGEDEGDDSNE